MIVRAASASDYPAVEELYGRICEAMEGSPCTAYWTMGAHPAPQDLQDAISLGNLFIATDADPKGPEPEGTPRLLGAFVIDSRQDGDYNQAPWACDAKPDEVCIVHLLGADPDAHGRGVGSQLVRAAISIARKRGARTLRLDVVENNLPAIRLYRREGFADLGVYTMRYDDGFVLPSHLMEYVLDESEAPAEGPHPLLSPATLASCELCPRACLADRAAGNPGVCGADGALRVARAALHLWEEPPISGDAGSGTIFFSGCPLKCVYCQNHEISTENFGLEIPPERLVRIMLELQEQGALNINLVTATHYAHLLPQAISAARAQGLRIPIVYNTSGYERVRAVRELGDLVDIWLTDFKYADAGLARSLSHVPDYPAQAARALAQMVAEVERRGGVAFDDEGIMRRGIIVRHLVLPGHADDSCRVLDAIWDTVGDVPISVMNQYTPNDRMRAAGGELARAVSDEEYERVLDHADDLGFTQMYWQEGGAVSESFTPAFDTSGVLRAATAPIAPRR